MRRFKFTMLVASFDSPTRPALICHDERRPPAIGLGAPIATLTLQFVLSHWRERLIVEVTRRLHLSMIELVVG